MADSPILPGSHVWRLTPDGRLPDEFWRFFRSLVAYVQATQGNAFDVAELEQRVASLEQGGVSADILGLLSVQVLGSLGSGKVVLQLRGDSANPGASHRYGTDESGNKGWWENLLSSLADVDLTTPPALGDALVFDGAKWAPAQVSPPQTYSRITADGDVRVTANGDIRITD